MLNIYTDMSFVDKGRFIADIELYASSSVFRDNEFTRKVLSSIEHGTFVDREIFKDRFDRPLFYACLSTTSKLLLTINDCNKDYIFNGIELGRNGYQLLPYIHEGSIYIYGDYRIEDEFIGGVSFNGTICRNLDELNERMVGY